MTNKFSRFLLVALMFLGALGAAGIVFPDAAQAQAAAPPAEKSNWQVVADFLSDAVSSNAQSTKTVYEANYNMMKGSGCWGCKVFDSFATHTFEAGKAVSSGSSMGSLASVIVAVASLFSLFYIGSAFVSGDASDLLNRWKVFWRLLIAVAVGTAWLTTGGKAFDNTWNVIYGPLLEIPLAVAKAVPGGMGSGECGAGPVPSGIPSGASHAVAEMRQVVCGGHLISIRGMAFGLALAGSGDGFIGTLMNFFAGVAVLVVFFWVAISFPLRFIDVLLRLAVVGIVTPVLVVCAVFKPTRGYVQIAISNVLYAGALFAFTAIMFKLGGNFFDDAANARIASMGTWDVGTMVSESILLVGAAVIFASMLRMAPALASEFSQFRGSSGGVGDAATGFASSSVTLPAKAGTAVVAAKLGGGMVGKAAGQSMGKSLGRGVSSTE